MRYCCPLVEATPLLPPANPHCPTTGRLKALKARTSAKSLDLEKVMLDWVARKSTAAEYLRDLNTLAGTPPSRPLPSAQLPID